MCWQRDKSLEEKSDLLRKKKEEEAGIFAKSLATSRILIINFYSEYNLFAHEETQFFLQHYKHRSVFYICFFPFFFFSNTTDSGESSSI